MNDPQIWTLIGVFSAAVLGMMTIMIMLFSRVIRAEIGGLDGRLTGAIGAMEGRLTGQIDTLDVRLTGRIDALDKEVADIATRFFGKPG